MSYLVSNTVYFVLIIFINTVCTLFPITFSRLLDNPTTFYIIFGMCINCETLFNAFRQHWFFKRRSITSENPTFSLFWAHKIQISQCWAYFAKFVACLWYITSFLTCASFLFISFTHLTIKWQPLIPYKSLILLWAVFVHSLEFYKIMIHVSCICYLCSTF